MSQPNSATPPRAALAALLLGVALTVGTALPAAAAGPYPDGATGYDISWPQCGGGYPPGGSGMAIVGINGGHPFSTNPCLGSEWSWAKTSPNPPSAYLNTNWDPASPQGSRGPCTQPTVDCQAYNYGVNAAAYGINSAHAANVNPAVWWLDVETGDSWFNISGAYDQARDSEVIQGMIDVMHANQLTVGIYSTAYQFDKLMGTGYAPQVPLWVPDFNDNNPVGYCLPAKSFGGGEIWQVQYTGAQFDQDYSCPARHGYYMVAGDGGIFPFGDAAGYGSTGNRHLNKPVVGMASVPSGGGYWLVAADGGIFPFGPGAAGYGSTGNRHLNQPVVGMTPAPDGHGYWLVAADGGIFPFGPSAHGYGSTGNIRLNRPIVGMAPTPSGHGYWLVAADGGIFPFGDATGYGSTGNLHLYRPIVGMAATADGHGYWLVSSDGGIFPFGDAPGYGSAGSLALDSPVVGMARTMSGQGYWLVTQRGHIIPFGDAVAQAYGSWYPRGLSKPMLGMAPSL